MFNKTGGHHTAPQNAVNPIILSLKPKHPEIDWIIRLSDRGNRSIIRVGRDHHKEVR